MLLRGGKTIVLLLIGSNLAQHHQHHKGKSGVKDFLLYAYSVKDKLHTALQEVKNFEINVLESLFHAKPQKKQCINLGEKCCDKSVQLSNRFYL